MSKPILQSSLGRIAQNSIKRDRVGSLGYLAFGKVIDIHHKRHSADVQLLHSNDIVMSSTNLEGRFSCKIGVENAGFNEDLKRPYGKIIPLQKGNIVLVGFLTNSLENPVIISVFHDVNEDIGVSNDLNILTSTYPLTDTEEIYRYTNINRLQDFITISGSSNVEIANHHKSFIIGTDKSINPYTFDYEDLSIKGKDTKTINAGESNFKNLNWLIVIRDKFRDNLTNYLKVFIDTLNLSFKLIKIQRSINKSTSLEITQDGGIIIRRDQNDTQPSNSNYSKIEIQENGNINLVYDKNSKTIHLTLTDVGVSLNSSENIDISSGKSVTISGKRVNIGGVLNIGQSFDLPAGTTKQGRRVAKEGDQTSNGARIL